MFKSLVIILVLLFTSSSFAGSIVNIMTIAGKTQNEVEVVLGKASSCNKNKYGEKCQYQKGETEIVFIDGKSDWITIEAIDHVQFSLDALTSIGLKAQKPSFQNDFTLRWDSIKGLREVSIFKGGSFSDYAYIKVRTK